MSDAVTPPSDRPTTGSAVRPGDQPRVSVPRCRRRLTGTVLADLGVAMAVLGVLISAVFPFAVIALGVPSTVATRPAFVGACFLAGLVLALCNWMLARRVVGRRLAVLTDSLVAIGSQLRATTAGTSVPARDLARRRLPVDSTDELGAAYGAVNDLLSAVATAQEYRSVVQASSDVITLVEENGLVRFVSPSVQAVLGRDPAAVIGHHISLVVHPDDRDAVVDFLIELVSGTVPAPVVTRVRHGDGRWRCIETAGVDRLEDDGLRALVLTSRDVTERQALSQQLAHQALHDGLTGLPNRTLLHDRIEHAVALAGRTREPLAVLLLDLDRFKEVNDTLGHDYGDKLLRQVAERLRSVLREGDTAARLGGDEFAVVATQLTSAEDGRRIAERITAAMEEPFVVDGAVLHVEASVGVATAPAHGANAAVLLRCADVAMYVAKRGRTGVAVYDAAQDENSPDRLILLGDLRRAVEAEDELFLHYQPKVDLPTGRLVGVEALLRWQHPTRGPVPPGTFIPVAEGTGLIHRITLRVLDLALAQARVWMDAGHAVPVAVNLSTRVLVDLGFPDHVAALLAEHGVPSSLLRLEITESAVMADEGRSHAVLEGLHDLGIHLSIDDFGTGYSSMSYLKDLPVDELKVDRSFVLAMLVHEGDAVLVRSAIDLGHNLGLTVVAEGVEDGATLEVLTRLGCDVAQGYHLGRPVLPNELEPWLARLAEPSAAAAGGAATSA